MAYALPHGLQAAFEEARSMEASVAERLDHFAAALADFAPTFTDAVDRMVARLKQQGAGISAPEPGQPLPPFLLTDEAGKLVSCEEILARGPTAFAFHRGHWCPYCRINTRALAEAHAQVRASGGQIVAITPERQQFAMEQKEDADAPFPILTDLDNAYAMSLNLAISLGDELLDAVRKNGVDLPRYQNNDAWLLPIPATFVVGTDGVVKARFVDPDYRRRMPIDELKAALASCA